MIKIINVTEEEKFVMVENRKEAAEFVANAGITDNSVKTISNKIGNAIKEGNVIYDIFKFEETEGELVAVTNSETVKNGNEEIVYDNPANFAEGVTEDEKQEVVEEIVENEKTAEVLEEEYLESPEAADEVEKENKEFEEVIKGSKKEEKEEKPNKRRIGKGIVAYKNGEVYETFPSIKATATHFKELLGLQHMPFTPIMKSVRQDVDWNEYSFKPENQEDFKPVEKTADEPEKQEKEEMKDVAEQTSNQDEEIEELVEEEIKEA